MAADAVPALINAFIVAIFGGGSAFLFGIWDRRRSARVETTAASSQERKELADHWRDFIERLEADVERKRLRMIQYQVEVEKLELEKDWVWAALRKYEAVAHKLRHDAINKIWVMARATQFSGAVPELDPLPSAHTLYTAEKEGRA